MRQTIHFEDDLYFIDELINALEAGLQLKLDSQFFFDKLVEDIFFLDATLNMLSAALDDNPQIVQLPAILRNIQISKMRFCELLDIVLDDETGIDESFAPFRQKLTVLKDAHQLHVDQISSQFSTDDEAPSPREGISREEYQFLFPDDEEPV